MVTSRYKNIQDILVRSSKAFFNQVVLVRTKKILHQAWKTSLQHASGPVLCQGIVVQYEVSQGIPLQQGCTYISGWKSWNFHNAFAAMIYGPHGFPWRLSPKIQSLHLAQSKENTGIGSANSLTEREVRNLLPEKLAVNSVNSLSHMNALSPSLSVKE